MQNQLELFDASVIEAAGKSQNLINEVRRGEISGRVYLLEKYSILFESTFGVSLKKYMHPLFGFLIVEFDRRIGTPDGMSTVDWLLEKYGKDVLDMINEIIDLSI